MQRHRRPDRRGLRHRADRVRAGRARRWCDDAILGGVVEHCVAHDIPILRIARSAASGAAPEPNVTACCGTSPHATAPHRPRSPGGALRYLRSRHAAAGLHAAGDGVADRARRVDRAGRRGSRSARRAHAGMADTTRVPGAGRARRDHGRGRADHGPGWSGKSTSQRASWPTATTGSIATRLAERCAGSCRRSSEHVPKGRSGSSSTTPT